LAHLELGILNLSSTFLHKTMEQANSPSDMDSARPREGHTCSRTDLFDYSKVVTLQAGQSPNEQYFSTDSTELCRESVYFHERLNGDYEEAKSRHFNLPHVDPSLVRCMLFWYRGWPCAKCSHDLNHAWQAYFLAEELLIERYKQHVASRVKALSVDYGDS
jgi:hypothetical protein